MYVDSYLEMFTTLFGWMFYNNLWYVLKDTGLLLLPFIGIVLDQLINYKNGVEAGDAEDLATKGVLTELIIACWVIMMCGVPYMNFQSTEVVFTPSSMDESFTLTSYHVNSLESTFGQAESFGGYPISVNVPIFWWAVHNVSIGITHAVMSGVPPSLDFRRYMESLKRLNIEDPELRKEVGAFKRDCYTKALSKYNDEKPYESGPYVTPIAAFISDKGEEDPYWVGSHIFQNVPGYYDSLRSELPVDGFPFFAARDVEWDAADPNKPENGRPFCDSWWNNSTAGIKQRIIDENSWIDTLSGTVEAALTFEDRQDLLVRVSLFQSIITYTPRGYDFAYSNTSYDNSAFTNVLQNSGRQVLAGIGTAWERGVNSVNVTLLLNATPILQAILLMLVVLFIPFVLFLSKYSISAMLAVAWALFSFRFLTACWMFAWWLDQNITAALYPAPGDFTKTPLFTSVELNTNEVLLYMLNYLYVVIPLIFTIVTGWAGYNIIRGMGASSMMGGLSSAGGKAASTTGKLAKQAATKGAK
jgi:hypothetical protein